MPSTNVVLIAGYQVHEATPEVLAGSIYNCINTAQKRILLFANTNFIVTCGSLRSRMLSDDIIIVNDGIGMDVASILMHGRKFKANLNGTDFMPYFFLESQRKLRVFLLGGSPTAINGAACFLEQKLGHVVVGACDGYDGIKNASNLVDIINAAYTDVVLVALGNAQQEEWILDNYQQINANFFAGVGGLFDFWSGDKPRAPKWLQNIRMEWFYRLCIEPKRLYKRYTFDVLRFLVSCIQYRKQGVK
jgi:beta-1,4-glucosyltransferase